jgi:hypothetical protein
MKNVFCRLHPEVYQVIQYIAIHEETTIGSIVNEALMAYVKWMRRAELRERGKSDVDLARIKQELATAEDVLKTIIEERCQWGRNRGRHKKMAPRERGRTKKKETQA